MIHIIYISVILWMAVTFLGYYRWVNKVICTLNSRVDFLEGELTNIFRSAVDSVHHRATGHNVFAGDPVQDNTPDVPITGSKRRYQQEEEPRLAAMSGTVLTDEDRAHLRMLK